VKLAEVLISGLAQGLLYSLIALGFVLVYRATQVVNFAQGALSIVGVYAVIRFQADLGFWGALAAAVAGVVVLSVLIDILVTAPMRRRGDGAEPVTIVTIGLYVILLADVNRRIGADTLGVRDPWGSGVARLGSVLVPHSTLASLTMSLLVVSAIFAVNRWTGWGLSMRAAAEDQFAAGVVGVRRGRVAASAWALAGLLAVLAGLFMTVFPTPGLNTTTSFAVLAAFPAAVIGGMDSLEGALVGGLMVGVAQQVVAGFGDVFSFLGHGAHNVAPWALMLVVLLVRPQGLFGSKEIHRV